MRNSQSACGLGTKSVNRSAGNAAVHYDRLAGNEAGFLAEQEPYHRSDVFNIGESAERRATNDLHLLRRPQTGGQRAFEISRSYRVHGDEASPYLPCQRSSYSVQTGLGSRVSRQPRVASNAYNGTNI